MPQQPAPNPGIAGLRDERGIRSRQLDREEGARLAGSLIGFAAGRIYLPVWVVLPLTIIHLEAEALSRRMLRDTDRRIAPRRRRAVVVACVSALEFAFVLPAGIMWHLDDPFAKSLAVGLSASALMHLATLLVTPDLAVPGGGLRRLSGQASHPCTYCRRAGGNPAGAAGGGGLRPTRQRETTSQGAKTGWTRPIAAPTVAPHATC